MKFSEYYTDKNEFVFIDDIRAGDEPWSALDSVEKMVDDFVCAKRGSLPGDFEKFLFFNSAPMPDGESEDRSIMIMRTAYAHAPVCDSDLKIYIGPGTILETGAVIKGPCVIGERCEIRHGAYIRGGVIVGDSCVIGHATEVKNSIIMDHSNAGHFNYLGDSVVGSYCNLGAGTVLANLKFRGREELLSGTIKNISTTSHTGEMIRTGRNKLGAVIGDFTEIGCNTVVVPGALVGSDCWIYPNTTVNRGVYPPASVIRNKGAMEMETVKRKSL
ncbi:MAG: glucose-1-phosphate thymidylyltransferase [Nitrospinota bacterium]|nr:glucose-1-phosphate thymidylyltransferase [Nitrospinota bacterium]